MRFRGAFEERDKYRSRDRVVRAHNNANCTGVWGDTVPNQRQDQAGLSAAQPVISFRYSSGR